MTHHGHGSLKNVVLYAVLSFPPGVYYMYVGVLNFNIGILIAIALVLIWEIKITRELIDQYNC